MVHEDFKASIGQPLRKTLKQNAICKDATGQHHAIKLMMSCYCHCSRSKRFDKTLVEARGHDLLCGTCFQVCDGCLPHYGRADHCRTLLISQPKGVSVLAIRVGGSSQSFEDETCLPFVS